MDNTIEIELFDGEIGYTSAENKNMIGRLKEAITYLDHKAHSSNVTSKATERLYEALDEIADKVNTDHYISSILKECESEIIEASKNCGYWNIQYSIIEEINKILNK